MNTSENITEISKALIELNKVIVNPKNSTENPFFKKKYAPLSDILSEVRPVMAGLGLVVIQDTTSEENRIGIQTMILHSSGQYIKSNIMYIKSDKDNAQGQGSAITYGRRYQLSAMLSIASEDDDDGNDASTQNQQKTAQKPVKTEHPKADVTPEALKNDKGKIVLEKGKQEPAMAMLQKAKTEQEISEFLTNRAKRTWTTEELKEQDDLITDLRAQWKAEADAAANMQ